MDKTQRALLTVKAKISEALSAAPLTGERIDKDGMFLGYLYPGDEELVIVLHGGGFLMPGAGNCEKYCLLLREKTGHSVFAPEYPLTPEWPYPAALDFVCDLIRCFGEKYERISLAGHSAGANLAAAAALRGMRIEKLVLDYPYLDLVRDPGEVKRSKGGVSEKASEVFRTLYCKVEERALPEVSPLFASRESFKMFPQTLIIGASEDGLLVDAETFHKKLRAAGADAELRVFEDVNHAFIEDAFDTVSMKLNPVSDETKQAAMDALEITAEFLQ